MYMSISIVALVFLAAQFGPEAGPEEQIQTLQKMVHELREEVSELRNEQSTDWIAKQRVEEIHTLVQDVFKDAEDRANLQGRTTLAGYDGGAFLQSADGNWSLKINGQIQARWSYNNAEGQLSQHGFEMRRTKVKFSGHVIDPTWNYKISTTWGRGGGSNTEDAYIQKKFDNDSWFKFGQFKTNFLREDIVSSSKQLTVERSMLNNAFAYGWTQGFEWGWRGDDVKIVAQYTDGPNQSNTTQLQTRSSVNAWTVRSEFRFGDADWKDFDYQTSKDGAKSGVLLGVAYQTFDLQSNTNANGIEYGNANAFSSSGWTVDASWRGDGWNLFGYYTSATGKGFNDIGEQDSDGWLIQSGFMLNPNVEMFGQYQKGTITGASWANGSNAMDAIRVGFNYWPSADSNALKWTTDIAWAGKSLAAGNGTGIASADWDSTGNGWRGDVGSNEDQMLLRTQLQLLF
jgi:hypothetical protein